MRKEYRLTDLPAMRVLNRGSNSPRPTIQGKTLSRQLSRQESLRTAAKYDKGIVSSPTIGELYLQGSIFLILSYGSLPHVEEDKLDEAQAYLNSACDHMVNMHSPYFGKFQTTAENTFNLVPHFKYPEPRMLTFLKANAFFWFLDDFIDNHFDLRVNDISSGQIRLISDLIGDIYSCKYETLDEVPTKGAEDFIGLLRLVFEVTQELNTQGPDYTDRCGYMVTAWKNFAIHGLAHTDENGTMWQSEHTHMFVRKNNGFYSMIEMIALLEGVQVPEDIRHNFLFQTLYEMANDVLGIQKELVNEEIPGNLALRKVIRDGLSLTESVRYVERFEQELALDFVKFKTILLKIYPDSPHLVKFLRILEFFTDWSIVLYLTGQRYGGKYHFDQKKVEVWSEDDIEEIRPHKALHVTK